MNKEQNGKRKPECHITEMIYLSKPPVFNICPGKQVVKKLIVTLPILILFFYSCRTVTVVKKMHSENVATIEWSNNQKSVIFVPMVHVAKPEFYSSVQNIIKTYKEKGFIVFYEGTKINTIDDSVLNTLVKKNYVKRYYRGSDNKDSVAYAVYKIKISKMVGVTVDSTGYAKFFHQKGIFKSMIAQPSKSALGIDQFDVLVDIPQNKLVDEYERKYGEIELEQLDFKIAPNSIYPYRLKLPKDKVNSIIIDYRNQHLASSIHNSSHQNIIIIYCFGHEEGTFKILNQFDNSWKRK